MTQDVWIVICFITLLWILFSDFKTFAPILMLVKEYLLPDCIL